MAKCVYCGEDAGITSDSHEKCFRRAMDGKSNREIRSGGMAESVQLGVKEIAKGVFLGMWLFFITASIVVGFLYSLTR